MEAKSAAAAIAAAFAIAACSQIPIKPAEMHLRADVADVVSAEPPIPAPVQIASSPPSKPLPELETYNVVVSNVRVQELLFAIARDAKVNIDIHPSVHGTVTLNAVEQTLPQLLHRIAKQVDMRYEMDGANLREADLPDELPRRDATKWPIAYGASPASGCFAMWALWAHTTTFRPGYMRSSTKSRLSAMPSSRTRMRGLKSVVYGVRCST